MRGGKGSKMKKILKVITSIAATGALFTNAYAAIEINSNIYNADNNSISVSGKITGAKANIPLLPKLQSGTHIIKNVETKGVLGLVLIICKAGLKVLAVE